MDRDTQSNQHQRNADNLLRQARDAYIINPATGIYEPKPGDGEEHIDQDGPGKNHERPLFVSTDPHWTDRTAAWVALMGLPLSILTLFGLGVTVIYAHKQWIENKRTADASVCAANAANRAVAAAEKANSQAAEASHRSLRAWIGIEEATPLGFEAETNSNRSVNLTVRFKLKNYGLSAADNIRFLAVLISDPKGQDHLSCNQVEKIKAGELLLPTQYSKLNWVMKLTDSDMKTGWAHQNPQLGNILILRIEGCILYSDRKDEPPHRTPFNYLVLRTKPEFITPNESIPGDGLAVDQYFVNSNETK